ncbi:MAG: hypothetical protein ACRC0F_11115 [Cetobacterium sp.]
MNKISLKIKDTLLSFEKNPQNSFPYFVSKVTLEYAYKIPETIKIITIIGNRKTLSCRKYRIKKMKNEVVVSEVQNLFKGNFDLTSEEGIELFSIYCGNIQHFFIYSDGDEENNKKYLLDEDFKMIFLEKKRVENETKYLLQNITKIEKFISDNKFLNKKIKDRTNYLNSVIERH